MTLEQTIIEGVYIINNFNATDDRGIFVKTFNKNAFQEKGISFEIRESYFSVSGKDVIRGMHFQLPPHDHEKLVYVPKGEVLDVVLDLRKNSSTFGKCISVNLSSENKKSIFIPKGCAHGFKALANDTITVYNVATEYDPKADSGIKYDSFGFDWEVKNPIVSARDTSLDQFKQFNSPF